MGHILLKHNEIDGILGLGECECEADADYFAELLIGENVIKSKAKKPILYNKLILTSFFIITLFVSICSILISNSYASTNINNNLYQFNQNNIINIPEFYLSSEINNLDEYVPLQEDDKITLININTATAEELAEHLPGIGEALSNYIVEYREENGCFNSIDELLNVKGIGKNRLKVITPYVTVE